MVLIINVFKTSFLFYFKTYYQNNYTRSHSIVLLLLLFVKFMLFPSDVFQSINNQTIKTYRFETRISYILYQTRALLLLLFGRLKSFTIKSITVTHM